MKLIVTKFKNAHGCTSTPSLMLMAYCLINHRGTCVFYDVTLLNTYFLCSLIRLGQLRPVPRIKTGQTILLCSANSPYISGL
jgi:hypothetical protein